jgi:hypothetical protein
MVDITAEPGIRLSIGISPLDPLTYVAVPVVLVASAVGPASTDENVARYRVLIHFRRGDRVERNPLVLGHRADVVRRHHAGVVGTVGEDDDHLAARNLALHRPTGREALGMYRKPTR